MDITSANRLVAIGVFFSTAIVLAFAFFSLTGGFRQIGLPGSSFRFDDDVSAAPKVQPRPVEPRVQRAPDLTNPAEPFRPQSEAEKAYFSAIEKTQERDARGDARRQGRQELLDFLASDLGKELTAAQELAKAGKFPEAKVAYEKLIGQMTDASGRVRTYILKGAIQVYQQTKDFAGLRELLKRYLSLVEEELSRTDLDARQKATASEMLDKVSDAVKEIDSEK